MDLLIDIGSTSIKWAVAKDGGYIEKGSGPFPSPKVSDAFRFEVNCAEIMDSVKRIILNSAAENVLFSVQMHGYVILDKRGRDLTPYVSWRDKRSMEQRGGVCAYERYPREYKELTERAGCTAFKPNLPAVSLFSQALACRRLDGIFCSLGSYVVYRLTGTNMSHITDLAASGFYFPDGRINKALCRMPEYTGLAFPKARADFGPAGTYDGRQIFLPVGDQQAAVYALAAAGKYILNLGTAAQLCCAGEPVLKNGVEARPYFGGKRLLTVTGLIGGAEIEKRLRGGMTEDRLAESMAEDYAAAKAKLPAFPGIVVCGGVPLHYPVITEKALRHLGIPYEYAGADAVGGLKKLKENLS